MDDSEGYEIEMFGDEEWANAHEMPVTEEMNNRMVRHVESGTSLWRTEGTEDEAGVPFPVMLLDFATDSGVVQLFLPPAQYVALHAQMTNHLARLWGMSRPIINLADVEDFLSRMDNGNNSGSDNWMGDEMGDESNG